jgi:predicted lactoylglutathione lyase
MEFHSLTPVLNVSDIPGSIAWFEKLGWKKNWDWGSPPSFASVSSGETGIFLCLNAQGSRGNSGHPSTADDDSREKGVWMSVWVSDVDAVYRHCLAQGLDVTMPPTDESWGVREMHLRHPDGHVFRISKGLGEWPAA